MRYYTVLCLFIYSTLFSVSSYSKGVEVNLLIEEGYFPLIVNLQSQQGLAFEFVDILNESQTEFEFTMNALPTKRLIKAVQAGSFDALFLMAVDWLPKTSHSSLVKSQFSVTVENGFYALKEHAADQSYFDNLAGLTKAGVLGYSYKFADYNTDENYLRNVHRMTLTQSETHVIKMLLFKRADVGVVGNLASQYLQKTNGMDMSLLFKSSKPDQIFNTTFLVNQQSQKITANQFDKIINQIPIQEKLKAVFEKYGISSSVKHW